MDAGGPGRLDRLRLDPLLHLRDDQLTANAFYAQGALPGRLRSGRTSGRSAGTPPTPTSKAAYWHKGHAFVADLTRGIDVLGLQRLYLPRTVRALARASEARRHPLLDDDFGGLCPLKAPPAGPSVP